MPMSKSEARTAWHRWVGRAATLGPKSVRSGNGLPLTAPHYLLLLLVSMPFRTVNRCCLGFLVSSGI